MTTPRESLAMYQNFVPEPAQPVPVAAEPSAAETIKAFGRGAKERAMRAEPRERDEQAFKDENQRLAQRSKQACSQTSAFQLQAGDTVFRNDGEPRMARAGDFVRTRDGRGIFILSENCSSVLFQVVTRHDITAEMLVQSAKEKKT